MCEASQRARLVLAQGAKLLSQTAPDLQILLRDEAHFTVQHLAGTAQDHGEWQSTPQVAEPFAQFYASHTSHRDRKTDRSALQESIHCSRLVDSQSENLPSISRLFGEKAIQ